MAVWWAPVLTLSVEQPAMLRNERGMTLIEVLAALAILGMSGLALVGALGAALRVERYAEVEERLTNAADRLLAATSLLGWPDLDRRLGEQRVGEFLLRVQRPEPTLYRIAIGERTTPGVELLVTVLYRSEALVP
jgi:prepilin-type N-terminal cleavage/methylation domain-containing protein